MPLKCSVGMLVCCGFCALALRDNREDQFIPCNLSCALPAKQPSPLTSLSLSVGMSCTSAMADTSDGDCGDDGDDDGDNTPV